MNEVSQASISPTLRQIRAATATQHARLESGFDAVAQLGDTKRRQPLIERYAALYIPADAALAPWLTDVADLDFAARSRAPFLDGFARHPLPAFPTPGSQAEALGMLYVLEGSTLGGRLILRQLAALGVSGRELAFLDPYGPDTSSRWRTFLMVLGRETETLEAAAAQACAGAERGFAHAEAVLCGGNG